MVQFSYHGSRKAIDPLKDNCNNSALLKFLVLPKILHSFLLIPLQNGPNLIMWPFAQITNNYLNNCEHSNTFLLKWKVKWKSSLVIKLDATYNCTIKVALTRVQGATSNEMEHSYWSRILNWSQSKCPRPKQIKLWFNLHGIILKEKPICADQKNELKEELMVWRIKV
jgi:hypothetical protein